MIFTSDREPLDIPNADLATVALGRAAELAAKPALIDGPSGRALSYGQLAEQVRRLAIGLAERGFRKGDVMAIFCPNMPEYAVAFLGVAAAGGINSTVNSLYSKDEIAHQLRDAGAKFLITIPQFMERAGPAATAAGVQEVFVLGEAPGATPLVELLAKDGPAPQVDIEPDRDLVALPYSSGTTGLSKGVMLTHANLVANMLLARSMNDVEDDDVLLAVLPFFHIYGMTLILCLAIYRGVTLVTMPRFELESFLKIIQDRKISCVNLVPPLVLALAKHPAVDDYDLSSLRLLSSGAAPLGPELERACAERLQCQIYQGYGLTEVAGASHILPLADPRSKDKPGSVGLVLPNTEAKIVATDSGAMLGPNGRGEVCLRGPHVMTGYLNNPEATDSCIDSEGWFHTGDIGYADDDGYFYIVDRVKELIKYKAYQVAPAELEALLLSHEDIADAAVIPSPDEEAGEIPMAVVVREAGSAIDAGAVMAFVASKVAPHKKVRKVAFVDEIPKSASGKILRRVLVERERVASGAKG